MSPQPWRPRPPGRQFDDTRRANPHWPLVVAEGDSWFSHPTEWNILWHLSAMGGYSIRRLASTGDELLDMVREAPDHKPQYVRQLERHLDWELLLFSGGGNDLLGRHLPYILLHRDEVPRGWRGLILDEEVDAVLRTLRRAYLWGALTVSGPWMYPIMAGEKGIRDADTRYKIAVELVDRFNRMLQTLASEHEQFHHVDLRGTLPSVQQWRDEIHPRSAGSRRMARTFAQAMDRALGDQG